MEGDLEPYFPSGELTQQVLEIEEMIESTQDTLRTPSKQSAGENSSSSILANRDPFSLIEISDERPPPSPFVPSSELLKLQDETEEMMDSIKASLMTPPHGLEKGPMQSDHNINEREMPASSVSYDDEIGTLKGEGENMMDSIKSSLMTSSYHDQFSFVAVGAKKLQESELCIAQTDYTGDLLASNPPLTDLSFISDDGVTQEINTLNDVMSDLKEDLQNVPSHEHVEQEISAPNHEETILLSASIIQEEVLDMHVEKLKVTSQPNMESEDIYSNLDEAKMIEERLAREILLAKEELLKTEQELRGSNSIKPAYSNASTGPCETPVSQTTISYNLEVASSANDSFESGLSLEEEDELLIADGRPEEELSALHSKQDGMTCIDKMDSEGLLFELAMIPIDLVSAMVDSSVISSIFKSGVMRCVVYVVQHHPREVLVVIFAVYLYRIVAKMTMA